MRGRIGVLILLCFVFVSCDSNQVFDSYKTVSNGWPKDEVVEFEVIPPDTLNAYDLFINIRNSSEYKYSNLFLIVEMDYPNGKVQKDTLEYRMTTPEGDFLGTGFSDVKENKLWYKQGEVFKESGTYFIKITHAMRRNGTVSGLENLEGVLDVGFRIERPEKIN